jgi:hypothetical protein
MHVTHLRQTEERTPTDSHAFGDTGDDPGVGLGRGSGPGRPRWVAVLGIVIAVGLVLGFLVLHLTGVLGPGAH